MRISNRDELILGLCRDKDVLDLGCANHDALKRKQEFLHAKLHNVARSLTGLEYDATEVMELNKQGFTVVQGDAQNYKFKRTFDVIVAGEIMEHIANLDGFLHCAAKHLAPAGLFLLTVPNATSIGNFLYTLLLGRVPENKEHVTAHRASTLQNLFARYGFQVTLFYYTPWLFRSHNGWKKIGVFLLDVFFHTAGLLREGFETNVMVVGKREGGQNM